VIATQMPDRIADQGQEFESGPSRLRDALPLS